MKLIKILGIVVLSIIIFIVVYFLYYFRSQTIDFNSMIGDEILVCNQTIGKNHKKFIQLRSWLKKNQTGWVQYPATQAIGYIYKSNNVTINVGKQNVVINYGVGGNISQVIKKADTKEINWKCENAYPLNN